MKFYFCFTPHRSVKCFLVAFSYSLVLLLFLMASLSLLLPPAFCSAVCRSLATKLSAPFFFPAPPMNSREREGERSRRLKAATHPSPKEEEEKGGRILPFPTYLFLLSFSSQVAAAVSSSSFSSARPRVSLGRPNAAKQLVIFSWSFVLLFSDIRERLHCATEEAGQE